MSTLSVQSLVSNAILQYKKPGLLVEMSDFSTGQEIYKKSLEHLVVPESKEVQNKNRQIKNPHTIIGYIKWVSVPTERVPNGQNWNNFS